MIDYSEKFSNDETRILYETIKEDRLGVEIRDTVQFLIEDKQPYELILDETSELIEDTYLVHDVSGFNRSFREQVCADEIAAALLDDYTKESEV